LLYNCLNPFLQATRLTTRRCLTMI
jgi:hypothetical protein